MVTQFVCDGLGISLLPEPEVNNAIESGKLIHILHQWQGPNRDIFAVWPTGRLLNAKAKCLRDYMSQYIEEEFMN